MDTERQSITQRRFLRGSQQLTIEGNAIKIERRRGLSLEQQCFDLDSFQLEPLRIKRVPLGRMLISLISVALTAALLISAIRTSNDNAFAVATLFGLLFTFVTLIMIIQTCLGFANIVAFRDTFRQIRLWYGLPDPATFNEFVGVLSEQIRKSWKHESSLLRQLRQANIIDGRQYDEAIALLQRQNARPEI